jgi:hypothetical protein
VTTVKELHCLLLRADSDGVHRKQANWAWGTLSEACECVLKWNESADEPELLEVFQEILIAASNNLEPEYSQEGNEQFQEHPVWSTPSARLSAAAALMWLAHRHPTSPVVDKIRQLSLDRVAAVRFQVCQKLTLIYKSQPGLFWEILERAATAEENRGVLQGLMDVVTRVAGSHSERIANLTRAVFDRVQSGPGANSVRKACISVFAGLFLWQDNAISKAILEDLMEDPTANSHELANVVWNTGRCLRIGFGDAATQEKVEVQAKAFSFLERLCEVSMGAFRRAEFGRASDATAGERARASAQLVDAVASQLYFASGVFKSGDRTDVATNSEERARYFKGATRTLELLANAGLPQTAHHLMEILEGYADLEPQWALLQVDSVLTAGSRYRYETDPLAADLMVRIVEGFLAHQRPLLRSNTTCRDALNRHLRQRSDRPPLRRISSGGPRRKLGKTSIEMAMSM